jgi:hypothetical protein
VKEVHCRLDHPLRDLAVAEQKIGDNERNAKHNYGQKHLHRHTANCRQAKPRESTRAGTRVTLAEEG